jgi:alpha-tubulin suppressor-like RCC1 family protein
MKSIITLLLLTLSINISNAQLKPSQSPGQNWLEGFMTAGANASSFRHFLLLADGTLQIFAPGEQPKTLQGIDNVAAISAGTFHILALKKDGTVWAWGGNSDRQLGNETLAKNEKSSDFPVQVTGISNAVAISAKGLNSYALLSDGTVWAWGNGNLGMSGDGKEITSSLTSAHWSGRSVPVQVKGIHNAVAISGPIALLSDGTVFTWGDGYYGRLGNGAAITSNVPVQVKGINSAVAIAYREYGALVLLADGTVWAWGSNIKGQLGTGNANTGEKNGSSVPVKVQGINNAVAIDANNVCMALLKDGTVKIWGWGAVGGMGSGAPGSNDINGNPLPVPGINNAIAIKAGNGYGCALQKDGSLKGWGANMVAAGVYHQTWKPVAIAKVQTK